MGYKGHRSLYRIILPEHEGFFARVRPATLGEIMGFADLAGMSHAQVAEQKEKLEDLFSLFVSKLQDWNLEEEDDSPVPTTLEALRDLDGDFALELVMGWLERIVSVPDPLQKRSNGGDEANRETSILASIPME